MGVNVDVVRTAARVVTEAATIVIAAAKVVGFMVRGYVLDVDQRAPRPDGGGGEDRARDDGTQ